MAVVGSPNQSQCLQRGAEGCGGVQRGVERCRGVRRGVEGCLEVQRGVEEVRRGVEWVIIGNIELWGIY